MSRSYKKHPIYTDGSPHTTKEMKKFANKTVRNAKDVPNGKAYRKYSESYNIHDFVNRWTWSEAKRWYEKNENDTVYMKRHYPTLKAFYRYWLSQCRSK